MNDVLQRRLVGLTVLLGLLFLLSWLLPGHQPESGETGVPSTTVPVDGSAPAAAPSAAATAAAAPAPMAPANPPMPASSMPVEVSAMPGAAPAAANPPPSALPAPKLATSLSDGKPQPPAPQIKAAEPAKAIVERASKPPPAAPAVPPPVPAAKAAAPAAAPTPTPAAAPAIAAAAPPAATEARLWYVQIGSFAEQGNAQTTLSLLQNIGYRGSSEKISTAAGANLYRVRLGPFPSEAVARQAFDKVSHQGYPQARVLSEAGGKH